jgi:cytochrome P450
MSDVRTLSKYWLYTEDFVQDPHPYWAHLRREEPVRRVKAPDGTWAWVVTRYADVRAALADPRLIRNINRLYDVLSRQLGREYRPHPELTNHLVDVDPPRHTRLRKALMGAFTRRRTELLRPRIVAATDELLDRFTGDRADLVAGLASPLPLIAVAELLGVPRADWPDFRRWSGTLLRTDVTDASGILDRTVDELSGYMRALVKEKRERPGEDLLSDLIHAPEEERLADREILSTGIALMTGGNETTVGLLSGGALALLTHPDQVARVRADPTLWPNVVEELIRYVTPVNCALKRMTTEPMDIGGVRIPAEEIVILSITSANRDGEQFPDEPGRFDISRPKTPHIAFGHGIHFCAGAHLARIEIEVAYSRLLARFPGVRLAVDPAELTYHRDIFVRSLVSLPVLL